ncbi:MAG TPA: DNA primase [Anaerolineae bacterium]
MSITQEIKSRLDIVDLVSEHVPLRKSGRSFAGFCPFHQNTRTPAFYVFPETQTWHCFGACAEGGDVFSFVMKKEGWDFREALAALAQRAGVTLEEQRPVDKAQQAFEDKLTDLLTAAADYFHQLLLHAPQAASTRQYVAERGLNEETQAVFRLGYALDSWDACRTHFNAQGYSDQDLVDAGLLTENPEKGTRYDRFRNRLMIPIRDVDGRVVGFGARTLDPDGVPKYLNSPQTTLFNKSHLLYGLDLARRDIRQARTAVIVEGYMDVMQAWQVGFRNVVAQMGTALTEEQLRLLKRYTKRFILALDADAAGAKATMRSLQVARETLDREMEVRFDARGLVRHEGRLQADIRVVMLPPGADPDKLIRTDAGQWPHLLNQAKPVVAYVIDVATRDLDLNDAKEKTAVARQVLPLIKDIVDPVERDHYWQELARALRVDERALRQVQLPQEQQRPIQPATGGALTGRKALKSLRRTVVTGVSPIAAEIRQADYLCQCLHYPQVMIHVNQKLVQNQQPPVTEHDFAVAEDKMLLRQMYQRINAGTIATLDELCDSLDSALLDRVKFLLTLPQTPESELERLADKLVLSVLDWRLEKNSQLVSIVRQLVHETRQMSDGDSSEMYQQLGELTLAKLRIDKARSAVTAMGRRRTEEGTPGRY